MLNDNENLGNYGDCGIHFWKMARTSRKRLFLVSEHKKRLRSLLGGFSKRNKKRRSEDEPGMPDKKGKKKRKRKRNRRRRRKKGKKEDVAKSKKKTIPPPRPTQAGAPASSAVEEDSEAADAAKAPAAPEVPTLSSAAVRSNKAHLRHLKLLVFFSVCTIAFTLLETALYTAFLWVPAMAHYHESLRILFAFDLLVQASFCAASVYHFSLVVREFALSDRPEASDKSFYWSARCVYTSHWVIVGLVSAPAALGVLVYQEVYGGGGVDESERFFPRWLAGALVVGYVAYSALTVCALQAFHAECEIKHGRGGHRRTAYLLRQEEIRQIRYSHEGISSV